jgi:hypothetical protein
MTQVAARINSIHPQGGARVQYTNADTSYTQLVSGAPSAHSWAKATFGITPGLNIASSLRYDGGQSGGVGYGIAAVLQDSMLRVKLDASWIDPGPTATSRGLYFARDHPKIPRTIDLDNHQTLFPSPSGIPLLFVVLVVAARVRRPDTRQPTIHLEVLIGLFPMLKGY